VFPSLLLLLTLWLWLIAANHVAYFSFVVRVAWRHHYYCYFFHGHGHLAPSMLLLISWSWSFSAIITTIFFSWSWLPNATAIVIASFIIVLAWGHHAIVAHVSFEVVFTFKIPLLIAVHASIMVVFT
jgi:hypothetical protein